MSRWVIAAGLKLIVVPVDSTRMRRSLASGSRARASHASRARAGRSRQRQSKWAGSTRRCTRTALVTAPFLFGAIPAFGAVFTRRRRTPAAPRYWAATSSFVKNPQAIEQIHGLGENRRCNLQRFEAAICCPCNLFDHENARPLLLMDSNANQIPFRSRFDSISFRISGTPRLDRCCLGILHG